MLVPKHVLHLGLLYRVSDDYSGDLVAYPSAMVARDAVLVGMTLDHDVHVEDSSVSGQLFPIQGTCRTAKCSLVNA